MKFEIDYIEKLAKAQGKSKLELQHLTEAKEQIEAEKTALETQIGETFGANVYNLGFPGTARLEKEMADYRRKTRPPYRRIAHAGDGGDHAFGQVCVAAVIPHGPPDDGPFIPFGAEIILLFHKNSKLTFLTKLFTYTNLITERLYL